MGVQKELTPLMKQYGELKNQVPDALLFFRMGDFYELFNDDAVAASRVLEITLTSRNKNQENPTPMAGVPHHSAQGYIQKLLDHGKKVAIAEQITSPGDSTKDLVKREIVRVFTPAIQFDSQGSSGKYLALLSTHKKDFRGVALDPSTGDLVEATSPSIETLVSLFAATPITHLLVDSKDPNASQIISLFPSHQTLIEQVEVSKEPTDTLIEFVSHSQRVESLTHLKPLRKLGSKDHLQYGLKTVQHLDLLPSHEEGISLFKLLNRTKTSLGARRLKQWISEPLTKISEIVNRQECLRELAIHAVFTESSRKHLSEVYDLDRLLGRLSTHQMNPADSLRLGKSLAQIDFILNLFPETQSSLLKSLHSELTNLNKSLSPLAEMIMKHQKPDAPLLSRDGGIFSTGHHAELDTLIELSENGERFLIELEQRERAATGIHSLKVKYNRVFGYFIEITAAHLKNVPDHYQRKQTMVGAERFFTEELKIFEEKILTASTQQKQLEQKLFDEWIEIIATHTVDIQRAASLIAELDVVTTLSEWVTRPGWRFPTITESLEYSVLQGRHPLVDAMNPGAYVPNDLEFNQESAQTLIITGPNMGGKSTVMRQAAMIVVLGQMGLPVPALKASWGIFHSIFTRIGAHDAITQGQSTFMVEMSELAEIIRRANDRSLIVLDEIGRGTSTYDGMSVAAATLEWIVKKIQARTLFATHYHELTSLETKLPRLKNAHMAVESDVNDPKKSFRFLYELKSGPANDSFGIQVAALAGLPDPLINRAWKFLAELEAQSSPGVEVHNPNQLSLFDQAVVETPTHEPDPVRSEVMGLNLNLMSPLDALNRLNEIQERHR
ncbi:MAG: DNA mismatch repair protein MutS [Xanthomonadaceae bacterium]|nr:DNA mismatch repair protein MutS [Xanthomonadaceae bacterium]